MYPQSTPFHDASLSQPYGAPKTHIPLPSHPPRQWFPPGYDFQQASHHFSPEDPYQRNNVVSLHHGNNNHPAIGVKPIPMVDPIATRRRLETASPASRIQAQVPQGRRLRHGELGALESGLNTGSRHRLGLKVTFARTVPEVIGEGGDEAMAPARAVRRRAPILQDPSAQTVVTRPRDGLKLTWHHVETDGLDRPPPKQAHVRRKPLSVEFGQRTEIGPRNHAFPGKSFLVRGGSTTPQPLGPAEQVPAQANVVHPAFRAAVVTESPSMWQPSVMVEGMEKNVVVLNRDSHLSAPQSRETPDDEGRVLLKASPHGDWETSSDTGRASSIGLRLPILTQPQAEDEIKPDCTNDEWPMGPASTVQRASTSRRSPSPLLQPFTCFTPLQIPEQNSPDKQSGPLFDSSNRSSLPRRSLETLTTATTPVDISTIGSCSDRTSFTRVSLSLEDAVPPSSQRLQPEGHISQALKKASGHLKPPLGYERKPSAPSLDRATTFSDVLHPAFRRVSSDNAHNHLNGRVHCSTALSQRPSHVDGPHEHRSPAISSQSTARRPRSASDACNAAFAAFLSRTSHFMTLLQKDAPAPDQYPITKWLQMALWWFLKGSSGLEHLVMIRDQACQTSDDISSDRISVTLLQQHLNVFKTWWIVSQIVEVLLSEARQQLGSGSRQEQDVLLLADVLVVRLKSLALYIVQNDLLPRQPILMQELDANLFFQERNFPDSPAVLKRLLEGSALAPAAASHTVSTRNALATDDSANTPATPVPRHESTGNAQKELPSQLADFFHRRPLTLHDTPVSENNTTPARDIEAPSATTPNPLSPSPRASIAQSGPIHCRLGPFPSTALIIAHPASSNRHLQLRTYKHPSLSSLYDHLNTLTNFAITFDGSAQNFSISRRRMLVPVYKRTSASNARILTVQQRGNQDGRAGQVQMVIFFGEGNGEYFGLAGEAQTLNFEIKASDTFEEVNEDKEGRWGVKLSDAKFALPSTSANDEADDEEGTKGKFGTEGGGLERGFVCLDPVAYAAEHEDITILFASKEERERFAEALPAQVVEKRGFTLMRRT